MTIEERLEKVEKELAEAKCRNRWFQTIVGLTVVGLGLIWILTKTTASATAATTPKEIRANSFILEDENGKSRAGLRMGKEGPVLSLLDENSKPRVGLGIGKEGPVLSMLDENGKRRAALDVNKEGPGLEMFDENGKTRIALNVDNIGPGLGLNDKDGNLKWGWVYPGY